MENSSLTQYLPELKKWCSSKPEIKRLWIYGSRVKGTASGNSDIDIAFQIKLLNNEKEKTEFREKILPEWKNELTSIFPWPIHLEPWANTGTNVASYVDEGNILVYENV